LIIVAVLGCLVLVLGFANAIFSRAKVAQARRRLRLGLSIT
jgi:hypothetical protein